jgi:tetratricopeptide (TPR) repeat protein
MKTFLVSIGALLALTVSPVIPRALAADAPRELLPDLIKEAKAAASKGRYSDAEKLYETALKMSPENAYLYADLGMVYNQEGRLDDAIKSLQRAIEIAPKNSEFDFNIAVCFAMEKPPKKELAWKYYKQSTDLGGEPDAQLEGLLK